MKEGSGTYGYDTGGRMTSAKHPFEEESVAYALDDAGNIVTEADFLHLLEQQADVAAGSAGGGHVELRPRPLR